MAFFNKLFPTHKNTHNKHQDTVSEKLFAFTTEQVRVVLFRECDFRGRKLLFDSDAVEKIPVDKVNQSEKFAEVSDGYGYLYTKSNSDYPQLSEMVFGSVAMSFRGTYFKIHSLSSPTRLMFTQVFPSPHYTKRKRTSVSSRHSRISNHSIEHSVTPNDSGASSVNSMSEQLSDRSTASDTVLVCRRQNSFPVEVSNWSPTSNPSMIQDSGCTDPSIISSISMSSSFPTWESVVSGMSAVSLSSCNLIKRLLRSSSRSLEHSSSSLNGSGSVEECYMPRPNHRQSKLGLAVVLEIPSEKEENLIHFFMEHIALLESMLWRSRRAVEFAYHRPHIFLSLVMKMAKATAQWVVNLLSGPRILNHWQFLLNSCDNLNSISAFRDISIQNSSQIWTSFSEEELKRLNDSKSRLSRSFSGFSATNTEKTNSLFSNISRFLKTEWDGNAKRDHYSENTFITEFFLRDFCEILEAVDVKDTNFFMSTLLTAVLTHHLGWVATCFPSTSTQSHDHLYKNPYNALWDQLTDLYGAIGHPVKTAQTVVMGNNNNDIITKIIRSLTYFIRCSNVERQTVCRGDIEKENKAVEIICNQNKCIPKENFKKYEDHLKEILSNSTPDSTNIKEKNCMQPTLVRNKSHSFNLEKLAIQNKDIMNKNPIDMSDFTHCVDEDRGHLVRINRISGQEGEQYRNILKTDQCPSQIDHMLRKQKIFSLSFKENQLKETVVHSHKSDLAHIASQQECNSNATGGISPNKIEQNMLKPLRNPLGTAKYEERFRKVSTVMDFPQFQEKTSLDNYDVNKNLINENSQKEPNVLFVLGDNEELVGLKKEKSNTLNFQHEHTLADEKTKLQRRPSSLCLPKLTEIYRFPSSIKNTKKLKKEDKTQSQLISSLSLDSMSESSLKNELQSPDSETEGACSKPPQKFIRAQSEPPETKRKKKYQYSRVKFNLQQYPQVITNYMKSKNIELGTMPLGEKTLKFGELSMESNNLKIDFSQYDSDSEEVEALQTPSNASELAFTGDLNSDLPRAQTSNAKCALKRTNAPNSITSGRVSLGENTKPVASMLPKMKVVNLDMPVTCITKEVDQSIPYTSSLIKGIGDSYIPDMVLQGTCNPNSDWTNELKNNLSMTTQHSLLDQPVEESVAILANTDSWEVQVVSSHTYVIDKGSTGIRVGMSQLVANMLDSLLHMWKLHIPPQYCIMHIEQKLQELCIRSKALAQLLLTTEFCNMEFLTSTLHLEVNDVPLLMAVASTHTPQVTEKYGLSFQ